VLTFKRKQAPGTAMKVKGHFTMQTFETGLRIVVVLMILSSFFVTLKFRVEIRRVLIGAADFTVVLLSLLLVIMFGAVCAYYFEYFGWDQYEYNGLGILGFLVGGAAGFIVASLLASVFLSLTETASNTRRMLAYYEPQAAEPQQQYADQQYYDDRNSR
jgi:hypothetical protein